MVILILGCDGYLGWASSMYFSAKGHRVVGMDNYFKRHIMKQCGEHSLTPVKFMLERIETWKRETGLQIEFMQGDVTNANVLNAVVKAFKPDVIIHFAEQPSGPWSMASQENARITLENNLISTLNVAYTVKNFVPDCVIVKIGTMGEFGTPNTDIPEGWMEYEFNGRKDTRLFPREAGSLYHTTKIMDTDMLWFYTRVWDLRVVDLMQGPVYGIDTNESIIHDNLTNTFNYGEQHGTCFLPESKVLLANGTFEKIQNIVTNSFVLSGFGNRKRVTHTFSRNYEGNIYNFKIKYRKDSVFKCTEDHPILVGKMICTNNPHVQSRIEIIGWKTAKEIYDLHQTYNTGYYLLSPKIKFNDYLVIDVENELSHLDMYVADGMIYPQNGMSRNAKGGHGIPKSIVINDNVGRLLGYYLANGSCSRYQTTISFSTDKIRYVEDIESILKLEFNLPCHIVTRTHARVVRLTISSIVLTQLIYKLLGKHAKNKYIDDRLLMSKSIVSIILGYVRGDGWRCKRNSTYNFSSSNLALLEQIQTALIGIGIQSSIRTRSRHIKSSFETHKIDGMFTMHELHVPNNYTDKLDSHFYGKTTVQNNKHDLESFTAARILDIQKKQYEGKVFNLEVEDDNTYLVNGFAVHNCLNRFLVQAALNYPLTVYGKGNQTRGYLNIMDSLKCIELAIENPPDKGKLEVYNQFTEQFSVNELAMKVQRIAKGYGINVSLNHLNNPRVEKEDHYYNAIHDKFPALGLKPYYLTDGRLSEMFETVLKYVKSQKVDIKSIYKGVTWW